MPIIGPMPDYDGLVQQHGLTAFLVQQHGLTAFKDVRADWSLSPEDQIAFMRDGDFQVGDPPFSAMHRLVSAWRVNAPAMRLLFDSIYGLKGMRPQLEEELEQAHTLKTPWRLERTPEELAAYHAADEALDAADFGRASLSGSLILLIWTILGRFKNDLDLLPQEWDAGKPDVGGVSVGKLIWAAANAFRHVDEWTEARHARSFTKQQKASMDLLQAALNTTIYTERPEWELVLDACSGGEFDRLAGSILGFANDVALMVRARFAQTAGPAPNPDSYDDQILKVKGPSSFKL